MKKIDLNREIKLLQIFRSNKAECAADPVLFELLRNKEIIGSTDLEKSVRYLGQTLARSSFGYRGLYQQTSGSYVSAVDEAVKEIKNGRNNEELFVYKKLGERTQELASTYRNKDRKKDRISTDEELKKNLIYNPQTDNHHGIVGVSKTYGVYGETAKKGLKYILIRLEDELYSSKDDIDVLLQCEIEHITPQKLSDTYNWIYDLGNTTLLDIYSNRAAKDAIFEIKKKYYEDESGMLINSYIWKLDEWNENEVKKRKEKLINDIFKYQLFGPPVYAKKQETKSKH